MGTLAAVRTRWGDLLPIGSCADSVGRSAGVAVLWRDGIDVEVVSSTAHHIDVKIKGLFGIGVWRLTGFYGRSKQEDKWRSWQLLRELKPLSNLPWVVIGDFNEILYEHEKSGGTPRKQSVMDAFREAMDECGLIDIGFCGSPYTWWNRRGEPNAVFERLDRALVTTSFVEQCPTIMLHHLDFDKSDHAPIKLALYSPPRSIKARGFKFEDMWAKNESCEGVVREAWGDEGGGFGQPVTAKLTNCSDKLLA
ncbi:uncharacterized protein LOC141631194 [Silene latifolia]|uniref:uncharacterized protein LOC141631194 n=1 Tax=Silene latifolia TaxID=37657 RepID=UPI003D77561A